MSTPQNIQDFNTVTGLIFSHLYSRFPEAAEIEVHRLFTWANFEQGDVVYPDGEMPMDDVYPTMASGAPVDVFVRSSIGWLRDEGFLTEYEPVDPQTNHQPRYRLSAKAFTALSMTPTSLEGSQTLGARMGEVAKEAGTEAGRSAIGELVGLTIGATARGFIGSGP
ncbi:MAG: hypothetical protein AAGH43_06185 [Pseudomonadota bacterium]